jgi:hypothetical protein
MGATNEHFGKVDHTGYGFLCHGRFGVIRVLFQCGLGRADTEVE